MNFIKAYFKAKFGAIGYLLGVTAEAWSRKIYLAFILCALWTTFCTAGGILLLPISLIVDAILWYTKPGYKEEYCATIEEYDL